MPRKRPKHPTKANDGLTFRCRSIKRAYNCEPNFPRLPKPLKGGTLINLHAIYLGTWLHLGFSGGRSFRTRKRILAASTVYIYLGTSIRM
jgi:hypothetical protein